MSARPRERPKARREPRDLSDVLARAVRVDRGRGGACSRVRGAKRTADPSLSPERRRGSPGPRACPGHPPRRVARRRALPGPSVRERTNRGRSMGPACAGSRGCSGTTRSTERSSLGPISLVHDGRGSPAGSRGVHAASARAPRRRLTLGAKGLQRHARVPGSAARRCAARRVLAGGLTGPRARARSPRRAPAGRRLCGARAASALVSLAGPSETHAPRSAPPN